MKCKKKTKVLALLVIAGVAIMGCTKQTSNLDEIQENVKNELPTVTSSVAEKEEKNIPTISLYPKDANLFSGLVTGYRGDYFAEEGGFQVEVWAFSDEKSNAILASGDLPDMMYIGTGANDTLNTLIETDKIINYDDYKEYLPNIFGENIPNEFIATNLNVAREKFSAGTGNLYVLPHGLGVSSGIYAQTATFDRNVVKLKWDVYEAIGTPEVTDLWQMLDVVEDMLEYQPVSENGNKMFGTFLDNGMDSLRFGGMHLWYLWHGCNISYNQFLVTVDMVNGTITPIFEEEGIYKEGVKWYNEMYRRGLLDPDSISTARAEQMSKVENGLAILPTGSVPGWQPYYYELFVPGTVVYRDFTTETMTLVSNAIVVNKESDNIEECLKFINMLADPYHWLNINYGPEGHIWKAEDNVLSITEEFGAWLKEKGAAAGFPMPDGTEYSIWNTTTLLGTGTPIPDYVDINGNELCADPTMWPDAQEITTNNPNWDSWKKTMNAENLWDYCEKNGIEVYQSSVFDGIPMPTADDSMSLTIASIKDVVVPATWNMVYADTDEELEKIWDQMVKDAYELGAQDVIDWFMETFKPIND